MYYRLLIAIFISWLLNFSAWAQSKIAQQEKQLMAYTQQGKYVEAMALSKQLARTYQQKGDTVKWLKTIFFQGSISYSTAEYLSAKKYYRNAYAIAVAKHSVPDYILFSLYHSLSTVYQDFHQTDSVKYFAYRTHELIRRFPDLPKRVPSYAIAFYISEGVRMYDEHNYQASNLYFSQVEKLLALFNDPLYSALTKSQIGIALQKQGHFMKADSIFTQIVSTYRKEGTDRIWFLLAAGRTRLLMKDLPVAQVHIDGAFALFQKLGQSNPDVEQYLYLRLGQLHAVRQTQDSAAIASLQKAISIATKHYGTRGSVPADAYKELSAIFARQGKRQSALNAVQQAVIATTATFKDKNLAQNPNANDYILGNQLFEALRLKAQLLAKDKPSLALQTHRRAIEVAFRLRREISSTESKLFFQQSRVDEVFAEALALAYQVGDSESFLWLMEQSQAATLGDLLSGNSLKASYLPPKVLEQEALLTSKITQLKMTLSQKADVKKETELQDAQLAMERFELELSQNYPKYVQAKLLDEKISIKGIQQQLAEDMAYVAFYVAKNRIFTLVINKQNVKILANLLNTTEYESQIKALRTALDHDPQIGKYTGEKASQYLYKTLFASIEKLLEGKTRLVISRNGKLNLIPLDVLSFAPKNYLVEKFAIGYAYNASLQFAKKSSVWGKPSLFVFAPFAKPSGQFAARGDTLKYLPATVNECRKLGGTLYSNDHARKTTFLETQRQQAQQGGAAIFHFATHSVIDSLPEKSFVAFHPSDTQEFRLFTTEIQNLNLSNIKLAVLNSCSSAYGQLLENEGLLSLGRAFTQAGCNSVAAALWEQNDASGSEISVLFHQYLAAGLPTDIALQKAKLDYLKQPHADAFRDLNHPYYWAALVLYGDAAPVYDTTWWLPYLLVGVGTLLVLLLGWVFWKRMGR